MAKEKKKDIGFGKSTGNSSRGLNPDGTFNVQREGISFFKSFELYHWLIAMSWKKFTLVVILWYTLINLIFALLYHFTAYNGLTGLDHPTGFKHFLDECFFSSQTLTTLGYGRMAPVSMAAKVVASVESMLGLMGFAFFCGLMYGRFSKPFARILYSDNAVVAPYENINGLMFRIVNERTNQLIETEAEVYTIYRDKSGKSDFVMLELEMKKINLFPLSWTIVHPIDEKSPFFGMDAEEFKNAKPEIFIILKAFDDTFSQTVYSRRSYIADEVVWGAKFITMVEVDEQGRRKLHLDKLNAYSKAALNVLRKEPAA
jgi:inward rectifier potassium channel